MPASNVTKFKNALAHALSVDEVNELGRLTGQSQRLRTVTPARLILGLATALGGGRIESLADLLREFNHLNDASVHYKAFYNRLARPGFSKFTQAMFCRLLECLSVQTLKADGCSALSRFKDVRIQDGSSFGLKAALKADFPGRFTTKAPAAVELHATYSGFNDEVVKVQVSADTEGERQFLPEPGELSGCLLLADRGYPNLDYFEDLDDAGGSYVVRLSSAHKPYVKRAWVDGKRVNLRAPVRLSRFIASHSQRRMDLDVEYKRDRGQRVATFRLVVLPGNEKTMTRLCTNLSREEFSLELISRIYRFRWQVELLFKEWKSYSNLHRFNTGNKHIAVGLIWASLCASVLKRFLAHAAQMVGGGPISTRRVAMCARHILDDLCRAILTCVSLLPAIRAGIAYLIHNARRANPRRDKETGRLQAGLITLNAPLK